MQLNNGGRVAARLANLGACGRLPDFLHQWDASAGATSELCQIDLDKVVLLDRGDIAEHPDQDPRPGHVYAKNLGTGYDLSASYSLEGRNIELQALRDYGQDRLHISAVRTQEGSAHVTIAEGDGDCHIVIHAQQNGRETTAFTSCDQLLPADQEWLLTQ